MGEKTDMHGFEDEALNDQEKLLLDEMTIYDHSWENPRIDGEKIVRLLEERGFLTDDFKEE